MMKKFNRKYNPGVAGDGSGGGGGGGGGGFHVRRAPQAISGRGRGYAQQPISSRGGINTHHRRSGPSNNQYSFDRRPERMNRIVNDHIPDEYRRPDGERWFKVTVVFGSKYDRAWILESLQTKMSRSFTPFMWRVENRNCFFYVLEKKTTAEEYRNVAKDIVGADGQKLVINVVEVREPVVPPLDPECKDRIKQVLSRRFLATTKALDLSALKKDVDFISVGLYLPLNKANVVSAVLELLNQSTLDLLVLNLSDNDLDSLNPFLPLLERLGHRLTTIDLRNNRLRSVDDLAPLRNCAELRAIRLEENPVMVARRNEAFNALKSMCPKLEKVNDRELASLAPRQPSGWLPKTQLGFFPNGDVRGAVITYLKEYYELFDSDRPKLLSYYTENATLTLATASPPSALKHKSLGCYISISRNLLYLESNRDKANGLVQRGRLQCASALDKLPQTNHLLDSLRVDVADSNEKAALIFVSGLFIELGPRPENESVRQDKTLRTFTRNLLLVPMQGAAPAMQIHSDDFYITHVSQHGADWFRKQNERTAASSATSTATATATADVMQQMPEAVKEELVRNFAASSGMNASFSRKCLEEFGWNFDEAASKFNQLRQQGAIPAQAFEPAQ